MVSKVLVTGASGFIGRALVAALERKGHEVVRLTSKDGEIDDPNKFKKLSNIGVLWVFHLAGRTYVPESWEDPLGFCRVNVLGVANVLEFCRTQGIPITYVSSYLYGEPESLPITENSPVRPNNPYALSKWLAEQICEFYSAVHGLPIIVIRPFNVYGVGQDELFLIPSVVRQALFGDAITVKDLQPRRDYVYLDDLVEALMLTMGKPDGYRVYNIGSGMSLSVREIIDVIQAVAHTNKKVVCTNVTRPNEINDVVADISRVRQDLGWYPRHSFSDGIRKIIQAALREKHE